MRLKIVRCERCGIAIPERLLERARRLAKGGDVCLNCSRAHAEAFVRTHSCVNCGTAIPLSEIASGRAGEEGSRYLCRPCLVASAEERSARGEDARATSDFEGGESTSSFCGACTVAIPPDDMAEGRARKVKGRQYCARCGDLVQCGGRASNRLIEESVALERWDVVVAELEREAAKLAASLEVTAPIRAKWVSSNTPQAGGLSAGLFGGEGRDFRAGATA